MAEPNGVTVIEYPCAACGCTFIEGRLPAQVGSWHLCRDGARPRLTDCRECGHVAWSTSDYGCGQVLGSEAPSAANSYSGDVAVCDCPAKHAGLVGRVVHCKRERYDVYIGRAVPRAGLTGSKWGNPFYLPKGYDVHADPDRILPRYEEYVRSRPDLMAALPELEGKVLGCWCAPKPCHGDVLLRLVQELEVSNA